MFTINQMSGMGGGGGSCINCSGSCQLHLTSPSYFSGGISLLREWCTALIGDSKKVISSEQWTTETFSFSRGDGETTVSSTYPADFLRSRFICEETKQTIRHSGKVLEQVQNKILSLQETFALWYKTFQYTG